MNETFDIEEYELQGEKDDGLLINDNTNTTINSTKDNKQLELSLVNIDNSSNTTELNTQPAKLFESNEDKRKSGILLFETNFDLTQMQTSTKSGNSNINNIIVDKANNSITNANCNLLLNDEFLENELIPDDLLDEIHNYTDPAYLNNNSSLPGSLNSSSNNLKRFTASISRLNINENDVETSKMNNSTSFNNINTNTDEKPKSNSNSININNNKLNDIADLNWLVASQINNSEETNTYKINTVNSNPTKTIENNKNSSSSSSQVKEKVEVELKETIDTGIEINYNKIEESDELRNQLNKLAETTRNKSEVNQESSSLPSIAQQNLNNEEVRNVLSELVEKLCQINSNNTNLDANKSSVNLNDNYVYINSNKIEFSSSSSSSSINVFENNLINNQEVKQEHMFVEADSKTTISNLNNNKENINNNNKEGVLNCDTDLDDVDVVDEDEAIIIELNDSFNKNQDHILIG